MQEYPVKRGYTQNLSSNIVDTLRECFGAEPGVVNGHYQISYGALKLLDVTLGKDEKSVIITTESNLSVTDEVIMDTNKRFRKYLDAVTGYTTKERVKKSKTVN
jgi:hypothetical protein